MSNYPDSFRVNCVGELPCNNNKQFCDVSKKPIIIENNNVVENNNGIKNNNRIKNNRINNTTTTNYCKPYKAPIRIIQDNKIIETPKSAHSWSNQRSYGNIVIGTHDSCNNVHGRVHPFNRINPLSEPYIGPAVKKDAWALNKVQIKRK